MPSGGGVLFVIDQLGENLARLTHETEELRAELEREKAARRRVQEMLDAARAEPAPTQPA